MVENIIGIRLGELKLSIAYYNSDTQYAPPTVAPPTYPMQYGRPPPIPPRP
jgi:hypothetical protein